MTKTLLVALLLLAPAVPAAAQSFPERLGGVPQASTTRTREHVGVLASDRLQGREAGTDGERQAAEYIAQQLARIGARPLPGRDDMFVPFEFTAGSRDGGSELTITQGDTRATFTAARNQVRALSFSDDADVTGDIVFAGYGIVVPEAQNFGYDSYATLDVTDKVVVVLRYFPEDADPQTRAILARYSDLRYKAMAARQRGARAMLVITGPRSPNAGEVVPMTFDTALAGSGIPAASVSGAIGMALLSQAGRPLAEIQQELDSGNPHVAGITLPSKTVRLRTAIVRERQTARNVVAYLPATTPLNGIEKPWVAIGAHYDHLGRGGKGTSLATREEQGQIHYGADDNASGTAAVLSIAEAMASQPRERNILIALWSAEEIGLVGSAAYASNPPLPVNQLAAYLNYDMVGRMQDNRLVVQATGTSPVWARTLERANVAAGFDLVVQTDPYQPTDVATFNLAEVASLSFTTGAHPDYHKPSDTAEKINYADLDRIVGLSVAVLRSVADTDAPPQFTKVDQPVSRGSIAGVRVTTGTIPDYATEVKGLLLGGVTGGGPAEQAGLMKGDIIVEIAGRTIANIYDYTYALELLKVNEPTKVVYMRGSQRRETTLTPAARR